ncbi:MAG: sigma-70 family RNA polymerase sigma factor [Phycisphaerales bacterium]|nr:sigma-70 family RNA polymerase sigma factor [Phycisphaerales bacterium]
MSGLKSARAAAVGKEIIGTMPLDPDKTRLQAILRRASDGDEAAWREIIDAYGGRVYALLFSRCRNAELAEEIAQSTFCTVVTKISGYEELGKFEPWLFRIAMNRLRDEMRRRGRHAVPVAPEAFGGVVSGDQSRSHRAEDKDRAAALWGAIGALPEADQQILHLRHVSEMSFKQIAEVLEQPMGTVLARHFRALRRLRETLGDEGAL